MPKKGKANIDKKHKPHPRNKHQGRYYFDVLVLKTPELKSHIVTNKYGDESIDFANNRSVQTLNKALLRAYYEIDYWGLPEGYLCPAIPGRADYIHHMADIMAGSNFGKIPTGSQITCMDIGVGANCVYPIIGISEYGWSFIGTDIDSGSIESANDIVNRNLKLKGMIDLKLQKTKKDVFYGVLKRTERIDLSICNPPFHVSAEAAMSGTLRKLNNLNTKRVTKGTLNFGGQRNELWCEGGENRFIRKMINESKNFSESCFWFSTLVSKQSNLKGIEMALKEAKAMDVKTIPMGQGNKSSRIVAWTFLTAEQQKEWKQSRWKTE